MKNKVLLIFIILILLGATWMFLRFVIGGSEDTWICQNGEWVKHGNPSAPKPNEICKNKSVNIRVTKPQPEEVVSSPLEIEGEARGSWYFEASFPIQLIGEDDHDLIAQGIAQAQGDWMTTDFVPFKARLEFTPPKAKTGTLILEKDNPSGLPENADHIKIPVLFTPRDTIKIKAYFNNDKMDSEFSCNKVFPVEREIYKTEAVGRAALEELLKGTTDEEEAEGFFTSINPNVKIQSLIIENGVAKVDFDEQLEFQVGGSCRVAAISWQIRETLKQFPTVKEVIISINGRTEDILQP